LLKGCVVKQAVRPIHCPGGAHKSESIAARPLPKKRAHEQGAGIRVEFVQPALTILHPCSSHHAEVEAELRPTSGRAKAVAAVTMTFGGWLALR
jgi:hypothetical protein